MRVCLCLWHSWGNWVKMSSKPQRLTNLTRINIWVPSADQSTAAPEALQMTHADLKPENIMVVDSRQLMKVMVDTVGQLPDYQMNCGLKSSRFFNIPGSDNQQAWTLRLMWKSTTSFRSLPHRRGVLRPEPWLLMRNQFLLIQKSSLQQSSSLVCPMSKALTVCWSLLISSS